MKKIIIYALCLSASIGFYSCKEKTERKNITQEIAFKKEGELKLKKAATDSVVAALDIEIADDDYQTQTGLMYRHSMPDNEAMLFIFPDELSRSFYMKNTEFPLDIIYFDSDKKIISIQKNAKPYNETSLPSEGNSMYVLEINGGLADKWKLENGDKAEWEQEK